MISNRIKTEGIARGFIAIHSTGAFCRNVGCSQQWSVCNPLTDPPLGTTGVYVPLGVIDMRVAVRMPAGA